MFIGRTDVEAETPILWPPEELTHLTFEKTLMLGKIEGGRKRGRQDEMVGRHHQLSGHILDGLRELVMGREAWHAVVNGLVKSHTQLSD